MGQTISDRDRWWLYSPLDVDFAQTLSVLTGWLGREVDVDVGGADDHAPLLVAELHGRLVRGSELGRGAAPADSLMFTLADEDGVEAGTFILAESAFAGAGWYDDAEEVLQVQIGVVQLLISLVAADPTDGGASS